MALRWSVFLQVLVTSILVIATTHYAQATLVIPDASYELGVTESSSSEPSGTGTLTSSICDSGSGGACETSMATVNGIQASISGSEACKPGVGLCASNSIQATASVNITYNYAVIDLADPTDTITMVPLVIMASLTTGVSGPGTSLDTSASGLVTWGVSQADSIQACTLMGAAFCPNPGPDFGSDASTAADPSAAFRVPADSLESIVVRLSGGTASSGDGGTGFTATLDPILQIAPDFLATNPNFVLELSENIPTAPLSVPEPSSIVLLAAGLFGMGFVRRRRIAAQVSAS